MNESALILGDFKTEDIDGVQTIELQDFDIKKLFRQSKDNGNPTRYLLRMPATDESFKAIFGKVRLIKAAGGLVKNGKGAYLFIYRLGKWDLPKGKVDDGERMKAAAVREVEEECGIRVDYLGPKLLTTYHMYNFKGELALKKTNWYEMGVNKVPKLVPQVDEDITKAIWLPAANFDQVRKNTYPLIHDLLDMAW